MRSKPFDKADYIPARIRKDVAAGLLSPSYRLGGVAYDKMPLYTFLIEAMMGSGGRQLTAFHRVVRPTNPDKYARHKRTSDNRLIYCFWVQGHACKRLFEPMQRVFAHIVLPDDPAYRLIEAFKVACDTKRAWANGPAQFPADIAYKALGIERPWATVEV